MKPIFLITAGPTREYLDPVRFLSNPSTGKMGYALARAARDSGARVILVSGPVTLRPPKGVRLIRVESAEEMYREVMLRHEKSDVVIMAAAVADYKPEKHSGKKLKKAANRLTLRMVRTKDILLALGHRKGRRVLVGFAAETGLRLKEAMRKLEIKNLDLVVANDVSRPGSGFAGDYNQAVIINRERNVERLARMRKDRLARLIIRRCLERLGGRGRR